MRRSFVSLAVAAALSVPAIAGAQQAAPAPAEPQSPHTLTGNVGFFSQYIFRGLTQTDRDPAVQGGFDYAHSSGFYAGTWGSNISWLHDFGAYNSSSLEWDFYGGYKSTFGKSDFGYDIGVLYYWYPGTVNSAAGFFRANTFETYGALSWKWLSAKLSWSAGNKTFGIDDSRGSYYLDLSANYPLTERFTLLAHLGRQKFKGNSTACVAATGAATATTSNNCASYTDWKLGASYALPKDFTLGSYFSGTNAGGATETFYTTPAGRRVTDSTFTVYLQKTF